MENIVRKMKRLNRILQKTVGFSVDFDDIAELLANEVAADTYIFDKNGEVLGEYFEIGNRCESVVSTIASERKLPNEFNQWLSAIGHTLVNYTEQSDCCVFNKDIKCGVPDETLMVVPVKAGGKRMGTIVFLKSGEDFDSVDILIGECGATAIGMSVLHRESEKAAKERRKQSKAQLAIDVLSFSELRAIKYIFDTIGGDRGFVVASKVADDVGITRSVIVNALRKLESAGIIESKSLGMKGTYIRALNPDFLEALDKAL